VSNWQFDGKANAHPGPPLVTPLGGRGWTGRKWVIVQNCGRALVKSKNQPGRAVLAPQWLK